MSTLVSPGVNVSIKNDTFYPSSGQGTVPLVVFATAQDKVVPGSTSIIAEGTKKANAGKLYPVTSQRDVLQYFGVPVFQEKNGTVLQGDELNEYGLHGLFSAMGLTNRALAIRADIDLNAIQPTGNQPRNEPLNQTVWFDAPNSTFGIFEHNGGASANEILNWDVRKPLIPDVTEVDTTGVPLPTFGKTGDYAVVPYNIQGGKVLKESTGGFNSLNRIFRRLPGTAIAWTEVQGGALTSQPMTPPAGKVEGNVWLKLDAAANGMNLSVKKYSASKHSWNTVNVIGGDTLMKVEAQAGQTLAIGSVAYVAQDGKLYNYVEKTATQVEISDFSPYINQKVKVEFIDKSSVGVQNYVTATIVDVASFISALQANTNLEAYEQAGKVTIKSQDGTRFAMHDDAEVIPSVYSTSNWAPLNYFAQQEAPSRVAAEDTLWYDNRMFGDFMINDGGRWRGLQSVGGRAVLGNANATIQYRQDQPDTKPDNSALAYGDVWVDSNDGTNFDFHLFTGEEWMKLDITDQSSTRGILFADARASDENGVSHFTHMTEVAKDALIISDYVDPDCPDPRLYPRGMIMCNMRQHGGVVRKYARKPFASIKFLDSSDPDAIKDNYTVGDSSLYPDAGEKLATVDGSAHARWITESGLATNGAGLFGREAQRKVIVESMAKALVASEDLRAETVEFNIMTAPGYVELLDELITLNTDRRETAYIITDVPSRLVPKALEINNWAKNINNAPSNGSLGRTSRYDYAAQYMGWGLGTNADGKEVCIPGASIALRTYLYSDSVSYVWFPPAGTERGIVTNAASIGYINGEDEYEPVIYNIGHRDTMYMNNINPIAMRPNRGLLVFGDKSLAPETTALDRVNVGRLVVYIRTEVEKISERFLFKLNTPRVQEEFAGALTAFLANIVQLEGLEDFVVVCDSSNNTAVRRQRNELWADIAIVPTKSINFIYVPIRIQNSSK